MGLAHSRQLSMDPNQHDANFDSVPKLLGLPVVPEMSSSYLYRVLYKRFTFSISLLNFLKIPLTT